MPNCFAPGKIVFIPLAKICKHEVVQIYMNVRISFRTFCCTIKKGFSNALFP